MCTYYEVVVQCILAYPNPTYPNPCLSELRCRGSDVQNISYATCIRVIFSQLAALRD